MELRLLVHLKVILLLRNNSGSPINSPSVHSHFLAYSLLLYLFPDEKQLLCAYFASNFKLGSSTDPPTPWKLILSNCSVLLTYSLQIRKSHFSQTIHTLFPGAQITKTTASVIVCFGF